MALSDGDPELGDTATQGILDNYGHQGWELCTITLAQLPEDYYVATAFFKRPG